MYYTASNEDGILECMRCTLTASLWKRRDMSSGSKVLHNCRDMWREKETELKEESTGSDSCPPFPERFQDVKKD